ncbi:hypothetical protein FJY94_07375 [Candidatus Kaiserbacteria bacterium]|nr:hypothetical protein [Candidatus Kaiserbacteria bacterium]
MDNRIAGLDLGTTTPTVVTAAAPIVSTPVLTAAPGKTILEPAKKLADEEEDLVFKTTGLKLGTTWYANGTKMLRIGEETAMQLRGEWEAEPTVGEAMDKIVDIVQAEKRVDYSEPIKSVRVDGNGILTGVNGNVILDENAWGQLVARGPEDLGRLRGNINLWTPHSNAHGLFRTRRQHPQTGVSECYAVMGKRYAKYDFDEVATLVKATMPSDAHATFLYDGFKWQIEVSFAAPFEINEELGVGRLHRISAVFTGADNGTQSIRQKYKAVRIRCVNCTTVTTENLVFVRKHVGQTMAEFLEQAMTKASEAMEVFGARWRKANEEQMIDSVEGGILTPAEVFKRLIAHGYVSAPGAGGNQKLLDLLLGSFDKEPGSTAAHINMAITRLAHEQANKWTSPWVVDELEDQAGHLLFNHVLALRPLSDEQQEKWAA